MKNIVEEPVVKYDYVSQEAYLEAEREALEKHEYYQGEIFGMSGASVRHNKIFINCIGELQNRLKGKSCQPYGSDLRIHIPKNTLYTYPDIVVVCGEPEFLDDEFDTLLNPVAIIEILSDSTESYDRGEKFQSYRSIPTLKEYLLVAQYGPHLDKYVKHGDGFWMLSEASGLDGSITLESIDCPLSLGDVYDKVNFETE